MRAHRLLALVAVAASFSACRTKDCRDSTLLVALTLQGAATSADSLEISVSIDGAPPHMQTVATKGHDGGNLEIDFPSGYPSGHSIAVTVDAVSGNTVIGSGMSTITLGKACERLGITVTGAGGNGGDGGNGDGGNGDGGSCTPTVTSCPADACGKVSDGCTGFVTCATPCELNAVSPRLANTGDTVVIEGRFSGTTTVDFPGAPNQPATLVGSLRAVATVPAGATAGDLKVNSGNTSLGPVRFRRANFKLGWSGFLAEPQSDVGRYSASMSSGRQLYAMLSVNDRLIAIGGNQNASSPLTSVETATINVDGTVNSFAPATATLALPRFALTAHVIGNVIHVLGGTNNTSPYAMNERATIAADGTIGAFATTGEPTLVTARDAHNSIVVGDTLYVLGGTGAAGDLTSIEAAPVNADGTLGTFAAATPVLLQPRHYFGLVATKSAVYVIGGINGTTSLTSVETAPINSDGTLGTFVAATPALSTAQPVAAALVIGSTLYVFGSQTLETAPIAADGTLGTFTAISATGNSFGGGTEGIAIARDEVVAAGGYNDGVSGAVHRAPLNSSGNLGAFALDPVNQLTESRSNAVVLPASDRVYIIGGTAAGSASATVEQVLFNPDDSFASSSIVAGVTMTTPRAQHAAAIYTDYSGAAPQSYLLVTGGGNSTSAALATTERAPIAADGTLGTFVAATPSMNTSRYGHHMTASMCAVAGATSTSPGSFTPLATVECQTVIGNPWVTLSSADNLKTARFGFGLVASGGNYWAIGSNGVSSIESASQSLFDVESATWTTAAIMSPTQETGFSVLTIGPNVYLIGGGSTTITRGSFSASFAGYTGGTTQLSHNAPASVVVGNRVYVFGGTASATFESAPLQ